MATRTRREDLSCAYFIFISFLDTRDGDAQDMHIACICDVWDIHTYGLEQSTPLTTIVDRYIEPNLGYLNKNSIY